MSRIAHIFRYPVKGLSPEPLAKAEVSPGGSIPMDRAFALAHSKPPAWVFLEIPLSAVSATLIRSGR